MEVESAIDSTTKEKMIPIIVKECTGGRPWLALAGTVLPMAGDDAASIVGKLLAHSDWIMRENAALLMPCFGAKASPYMAELERLCNDEKEEVRSAAKMAIERLRKSP